MFEKSSADRLFAKQKCFFGKMTVKYLGHVFEVDSLCADPDKVEAIHTRPKSTMVKELKQFLTFAS